jgi:hypothetical protein
MEKNLKSKYKSSFLSKKILKNSMIFKKKYSLIFFFTSQLYLSKKKFLDKFREHREKKMFYFMKKKIWKHVIKSLGGVGNDYYKLIEILLIGRKLNMKKNLAKLLSSFIYRKQIFSFFWKIIINFENNNNFNDFTLDFLILYGIQETGFFCFLSTEYLNFKIKMQKNLSIIQIRNKKKKIGNNDKRIFLRKILTIICCNFSKFNLPKVFMSILNSLGRNSWLFSLSPTSFGEMINIIKSRFSILTINLSVINNGIFPCFPILKSFGFFSILKEFQWNRSVFLEFIEFNFKFQKNIFKSDKKIYPSISKGHVRNFLNQCREKFYLYS